LLLARASQGDIDDAIARLRKSGHTDLLIDALSIKVLGAEMLDMISDEQRDRRAL
jgi:hypothetical protein